VTIQYAASRKEPWVRDGIDRAIRVELSRDEYEWLEQTAAAVLGPFRPASDLLRAFVLSAQQQMGADPRIERKHTLTHTSTPMDGR
jgi:hypothetical protein